MDPEETAGRLLDQFDVLRHTTDLDLLVFFARHPRSLLASEQIAAFLGYSARDVAASLELLLETGLLTRTPIGGRWRGCTSSRPGHRQTRGWRRSWPWPRRGQGAWR